MSISREKIDLIERLAPHLTMLDENSIDHLVDTGAILDQERFHSEIARPYGHFYAPFDWINDRADVVLIGVTPGKHQAKVALKSLRRAFAAGQRPEEAAESAKQAASFDGEMRTIAAKLMDRFRLNELFGLRSCSELFGSARARAHYTSVLRYPVLEWKKDKKGNFGWQNHGGRSDLSRVPVLWSLTEREFFPEMAALRDVWFVPFGPTPATILQALVSRGIIDGRRVLPGINHPSPTQRNRHDCQLNTTGDHSKCKPNVGCETLRERSRRLEQVVISHLS